jgi:beta-glucanase (GH16 family)
VTARRDQGKVTRTFAFAVPLVLLAGVGTLSMSPSHERAPHVQGARTQTGPPPGMHRVFLDDFSSPELDTGKWSLCYPWSNDGRGCTNFGNPELQWYLPSQVQVSDDALHLVASNTLTLGRTRNGDPTPYGWRSGMVTTYGSFALTYGYVSVEARLPKGPLLWPTLWLLPTSQKFPPEIDIASTLGDDTSHVRVVYHPVSGKQHIRRVPTTDRSTGWHTYAVNWQPKSITWSIDGKTVSRYTGRTPSRAMYFLAALAVANFSGGSPAPGGPTTASLDIRKVEVFQR